jgi:hypothetical protein
MKSCRKNLDKLKALCDELSDRDDQLKINASTLWMILERVEVAKEHLAEIEPVNDVVKVALSSSVEELDQIALLVTDRGCKKVSQND